MLPRAVGRRGRLCSTPADEDGAAGTRPGRPPLHPRVRARPDEHPSTGDGDAADSRRPAGAASGEGPYHRRATMRFAYLTTDEVNEALARDLALACGATLEPLGPRDGLPGPGYDVVLLD